MFGLRFAPDAKYWRRLWSVRFLLVGAAFTGVASVLGVFGGQLWVQDHPFLFIEIAGIVNVLALGSRLVDQKTVPLE